MDELDQHRRTELRAAAEQAVEDLQDAGVVAVALPWVDTSGITRVKAVPLAKLPAAAQWGVGMSPVFDGFLLDDSIVAGTHAGSAVGDLRLHPDLSRLRLLAGQPGWAWAPVDRHDQDGRPHAQCSRSLARRLTAELAEQGLAVRMSIEIEWVVSDATPGDAFVPALSGPAYGMTRLVEGSDYARDLLDALDAQNVDVDQFHPEYAAGQLEVSVCAEDLVTAADTTLLVRATIRAVSAQHGLRVSFSPKVTADGVGNGGHVHLSLWRGDPDRDGSSLMSGGPGPFGLTHDGEAFTAGLLTHLPGLLAVGAPSVASYLRPVPSHWAGAFAAWGLENREAALRFVTGPDGIRSAATLPDPVGIDPGTLSEAGRAEAGIRALPASLEEAVQAFEQDGVLTAAFGEQLAVTVAEVRRGEIALLAGRSPEEVADAVRWVH